MPAHVGPTIGQRGNIRAISLKSATRGTVSWVFCISNPKWILSLGIYRRKPSATYSHRARGNLYPCYLVELGDLREEFAESELFETDQPFWQIVWEISECGCVEKRIWWDEGICWCGRGSGGTNSVVGALAPYAPREIKSARLRRHEDIVRWMG